MRQTLFSLFGSWSSGYWGFIILGWWANLRAPWNHKPFSEMYGYERFIPLGFGWRFKVRRFGKR